MGLKKYVTESNGVQLRYHRLVSITSIVNDQTILEVASYTSQAKRKEEQEAFEKQKAMEDGEMLDFDVYLSTAYHSLPYDPEMTVAKAYQKLKELPEFEGAEEA